MHWLRKLFKRGPSGHSHPDSVDVRPKSYRAQVRNAFWDSVARLESVGAGWGHSHKIQRVDVRPGTVRRQQGWALPCKASPTGYAGGWTESKKIVLVSDPASGKVPDAVARHEWAHAVLNCDHKTKCYGTDAQHALMRRAGI